MWGNYLTFSATCAMMTGKGGKKMKRYAPRGKRCAICGFRTRADARITIYDQDNRIVSVICGACVREGLKKEGK